MKFFFLFLATCFIKFSSFGQLTGLYGSDTTTSLAARDYFNDFAFDANENCYAVGGTDRTLSMAGGTIYYYGLWMKIDPSGNVLQAMKLNFEEINKIIPTSDNNFIIIGSGTGLLCNGVCKKDMYIAKISPSGTIIWGRSFGNAINDGNDIAFDIQPDNLGFYIVAGEVYNTQYNLKSFICKLNLNGDTLWTRSFGSTSGQQLIQTLSVRTNGEIYVGGTASNGSGMILSKLTSNGDLLWSKSYANYGRIYGMYEQADQSLTLVANNPVNNYYVLTLLNVDGLGAVNWSKQLTLDLPASEIFVRSTYQDAQKNLYITGYHYNKTSYTGDWPFLLKTNNLGTVLWAKSYDEHFGTGKSIKEHPSLGIVWAGEHIKAYGNATQPDAWLVQTGTDGYSDCFQTIGTLSQNVALVPLTKFYTRMGSYITATPMPSTSPLIVYSVDKCMQNSLEITEHTTFQFINSNASLIFKIQDEELFVRVTDGQGRELANVVLNNIENTISTQNWHTGVYFLSISSATKSTTQAIYVQSFD